MRLILDSLVKHALKIQKANKFVRNKKYLINVEIYNNLICNFNFAFKIIMTNNYGSLC